MYTTESHMRRMNRGMITLLTPIAVGSLMPQILQWAGGGVGGDTLKKFVELGNQSAMLTVAVMVPFLLAALVRYGAQRHSQQRKQEKEAANLEALLKKAESMDAEAVNAWLHYETNLEMLLKFPEAFRPRSELNQRAQAALQALQKARRHTDTVEQVQTYLAEAQKQLEVILEVLVESTKLKHTLLTPTQSHMLQKMLEEGNPDKLTVRQRDQLTSILGMRKALGDNQQAQLGQ